MNKKIATSETSPDVDAQSNSKVDSQSNGNSKPTLLESTPSIESVAKRDSVRLRRCKNRDEIESELNRIFDESEVESDEEFAEAYSQFIPKEYLGSVFDSGKEFIIEALTEEIEVVEKENGNYGYEVKPRCYNSVKDDAVGRLLDGSYSEDDMPTSVSDLADVILHGVKDDYWRCGKDYYKVDQSSNIIHHINKSEIKAFIEDRFKILIREIEDRNKSQKVDAWKISVSKAIRIVCNAISNNNELASVVDSPYYPVFLKAKPTDKVDSLNTSTARLAFVDEFGEPDIADAKAFTKTDLHAKIQSMFRDQSGIFLDNIARHYVNLHHGYYLWDTPKQGLRDRVIVIVGHAGVGKSQLAKAYATLFGMRCPHDVKEYLIGNTDFNPGINLPVLSYDDPKDTNSKGQSSSSVFMQRIIQPISNGIVELNIKRISQQQVPFHGLLFACANPSHQENVLPHTLDDDVMQKILLFKISSEEPKATHDEVDIWLEDAKSMPAFLIDRYNKMTHEKRISRYVDSHYLDPELVDAASSEQGISDALSSLEDITRFLDKISADIEIVDNPRSEYHGYKRMRIKDIYKRIDKIRSANIAQIEMGKVDEDDINTATQIIDSYLLYRGKPASEGRLFKRWRDIKDIVSEGIVVARQRKELGKGGGSGDASNRNPYILWRSSSSNQEYNEPF